jgi:hypothetical protein
MRRRIFLIAILTAAGALDASPARDPKRSIAGQTVDITPLMEWWKHQKGNRPLTGWVRVTGRIVQTNVLDWTIEGSADDSSVKRGDSKTATTRGKFILKTPPTQEMNEFYQLAAKLKQLNAERDQLNREIKSDTVSEKKPSQQHTTTSRRSRARNTSAQLNQTKANERATRDRLDAVEKDIKETDKKLAEHPDHTHYSVDCFALKLNETYRGLPAYDHGRVLK